MSSVDHQRGGRHIIRSRALLALVCAFGLTSMSQAGSHTVAGAGGAIAGTSTRSGTIIDGVFTTGPAVGCGLQPDCAAWLAAGCSAALAGVDPAWHASIVDVTDRAGTSARFAIARGVGESVILGGVVVQFWTAACTELPGSWSSFWDCHGPPCYSEARYLAGARFGRERVRTTLSIPERAAWMTISAKDNLNLDWTLGGS